MAQRKNNMEFTSLKKKIRLILELAFTCIMVVSFLYARLCDLLSQFE